MGRGRKKNWKWILDLNIKCKALRLQEEIIEENSCDIKFGNEILDMTLESCYIEENLKLNFMKLEVFVLQTLLERMKRQTLNSEKYICKSHI